jgi:hypothetical protein
MAQIPNVLFSTGWTNHQIIMSKCKTDSERMFYMLYAGREQLENKELTRAIKTDTMSSLQRSKIHYISSKIAFNFSDGRSCKRFAMLGLDNAVMANDTAWIARSCSNLGIKSCIEDWILCDQEGICRFLKLKGVPKTLKGDNGIEKLNDLFGKANKVYQKGYQIKDVVATLDMGVIRKKNKDILKPL